MLLPHLSEDELFNLGYILEDRSKEPVKAYLQALIVCDPIRTIKFLDLEPHRYLDSKFPEAVVELPAKIREIPNVLARKILARRAVDCWWYADRVAALHLLAHEWSDETTRELVTERASQDKNDDCRASAFKLLVNKWPDETTRTFLTDRAILDRDGTPRRVALECLANKWPDETTRAFLTDRARRDEDSWLRQVTLTYLANKWPDETI